MEKDQVLALSDKNRTMVNTHARHRWCTGDGELVIPKSTVSLT